MNIFRRKLAFEPIDPLGDGLREAIEAERRSPEAIDLYDDTHEGALVSAWQEIVHDVENDPEWFRFASEDV